MNEIFILINIFLCILIVIYGEKHSKYGLYYTLVLFALLLYLTSYKVTSFLSTNINYSIIFFPFIIANFYLLKKQNEKKIIKYMLLLMVFVISILFINNFLKIDPTSIYSLDYKNIFRENYNIFIVPITTFISIIIIPKILNLTKKYDEIITIITITYLISSIPIILGLITLNIIKFTIEIALFQALSTYLFGLILLPIIAILIKKIKNKKKVTK